MDFNGDFEYYLTKRYADVLPIEHILEIVRHIDVNYIIPLKAELFTLTVSNKQRGADVIKLCEAVLNMSPATWHNPNGADEAKCMICYAYSNDVNADISEIEHEKTCAYLIAKDLSTNLI